MASICPAHQVSRFLFESCRQHPHNTEQGSGTGLYEPPPPLPGHQKASVLTVAITLTGLTLRANIPSIRYTSKHDCPTLGKHVGKREESSGDRLLIHDTMSAENKALLRAFFGLRLRSLLNSQSRLSAGRQGSKSHSTLLTFWRCLQMDNGEI